MILVKDGECTLPLKYLVATVPMSNKFLFREKLIENVINYK